ncbi:polyphosphate kinase 2 family protein [candidate division KSB1 bacterium]|nr:polyphosphate kinase 2 family protein [candidate division KSB1 bacterium]
MKEYLVSSNNKIKLSDRNPDDLNGFKNTAEERLRAEREVEEYISKTKKLQTKLYAEAKQSFLIVLQAMDAGGKDGTIKQVMSGVNPQGCVVTSFKAPTPIERAHDFLWRVHTQVPAHGMIGIFNRSHYEDVLWPKVHDGLDGKLLASRVERILDFEKLLTETGTTIIKLFLHISKGEQKKRLELRLGNADKHWKFDISDLEERRLWSKYMDTYELLFRETSTKPAPWYVIPANHKWYRDYVVARLVYETLKGMNPKFPVVSGVDYSKLKVV